MPPYETQLRDTVMTMQTEVLYEVRDRIAVVTLNRPERLNAYTGTMAAGLKHALAAANSDPAARVILITGAGRGFCAGADMEILSGHIQSGGAGRAGASDDDSEAGFCATIGPDLSEDFRESERFGYFIRTRKPVIAAINGPVAGIGLVMALYADLRFASDAAIFTTSFAQRGLIAEHGISWLLPRLVGPSHALDLLLSARKIGPAEAKQMGLVNEVFPQTSFLDDALGYAQTLATTVSPRSMAIMKAQVWKGLFQNYNEAMVIADAEMKASLACKDFEEGVAHFLEKREPAFADI